MDFCHLQEIYLTNMEKKLVLLQFHTATKIVLDAANVLHKTAEAKDKNVNLKNGWAGGGGQFDQAPLPLLWFCEKCIF